MTTTDHPDWITTADGTELYRTEFRAAGVYSAPRPGTGGVTVRRSSGSTVFNRRSWAELLYALIDLVPAITFFVGTVTLLSVGAGLSVIWVGVPVLAAALLFARIGGVVQRGLARALLHQPVVGPSGLCRRRPGVVGAMTALLTDGASWRAVLYHLIKIGLAPVTFAVALAFWSYGLAATTYPLWRWTLPSMPASDGSRHRGMPLWPDAWVDTLPLMLLQCALGLAVLWLAPRIVRLLTTIDRVLIGALLAGRDC